MRAGVDDQWVLRDLENIGLEREFGARGWGWERAPEVDRERSRAGIPEHTDAKSGHSGHHTCGYPNDGVGREIVH
jgi:hypothetical protein